MRSMTRRPAVGPGGRRRRHRDHRRRVRQQHHQHRAIRGAPARRRRPARPRQRVSAAAHEPVTISVGVLRPGATQEAVDALNLQISEFEAKYPWITVEPEEYNWTAPTFTAALAGGTLPDVFTIPFTDGKGLIAQHQIVNINDRVRALGYADKFNPNVLVNGQDADGKICARPDRGLRHVADLQPRACSRRPASTRTSRPTTWDEVRAAAKTIAEKTGVAGYAEMATENTGGWQLTTSTYANGGRMETVGADGKVTATLNNDATKAALQRLKDDALGRTTRWAPPSTTPGARSTRRSRPARSACSPAAPTCTPRWSRTTAIKPEDYGVTTIPLEGADAGVLGGGTLAAVNVVTDEAERDAAVNWIDFYYMQKLLTQDGAVGRRRGAQGQQPAGRRPGPADLRQGDLRRVAGRGSRTTSTSRSPR